MARITQVPQSAATIMHREGTLTEGAYKGQRGSVTLKQAMTSDGYKSDYQKHESLYLIVRSPAWPRGWCKRYSGVNLAKAHRDFHGNCRYLASLNAIQ
jgi:hypothetical protein